jgi:hypothetical protein
MREEGIRIYLAGSASIIKVSEGYDLITIGAASAASAAITFAGWVPTGDSAAVHPSKSDDTAKAATIPKRFIKFDFSISGPPSIPSSAIGNTAAGAKSFKKSRPWGVPVLIYT